MTEITEAEVMGRFKAAVYPHGAMAAIARRAGVGYTIVRRIAIDEVPITPKICAAIGVTADIGKGRYAHRRFYA